MLQPKRTKYRKQFKGRIHGEAKGGSDLNFGHYGLKATEPERITARQIEAARRALTRHMKRQGRVWIRIFPDVPVSKKPTEVRMGKGKGSVEFWAAKVKPGRIMFEIDGVNEEIAKEALRLAAMKLPIKTRFIPRLGEDGVAREFRGDRQSVLQPGDVVGYSGGGHVGIYIGDGQVVHAPTSGQTVTVIGLHDMPVVGASRY